MFAISRSGKFFALLSHLVSCIHWTGLRFGAWKWGITNPIETKKCNSRAVVRMYFIKKLPWNNSSNFYEKTCFLKTPVFSEITGMKRQLHLKKRFHCRYFPVNFRKFSKKQLFSKKPICFWFWVYYEIHCKLEIRELKQLLLTAALMWWRT